MYNYIAVCLLKHASQIFLSSFSSENGRFFRVFSVLVKLPPTPRFWSPNQVLVVRYLNLSHPIIFPTFLPPYPEIFFSGRDQSQRWFWRKCEKNTLLKCVTVQADNTNTGIT